VIYDVMDGSETLEAKLMSGRSGYDLVFPGDTVAERLMRAGSLQPLDRSQLTALDDIEPGLRKLQPIPQGQPGHRALHLGHHRPDHNAEKIRQRMPDAPLDSLDLLFKPELAAKFADCGISMIDSPDEVLAVVLNYLGREPRSAKPRTWPPPASCSRAAPVYPQVPVATGDRAGQPVPVAGLQRRRDPGPAHRRSRRQAIDFQYRVPREGTTVWMDTMAIPADAKHPEYAYRFINFVMRPENMAAISNFTGYPTASAKARRGPACATTPTSTLTKPPMPG
jgi:putrescine transport system substrate-binding protein